MKHERLLSLDAFRGFTIAGMILVNNPGSWNRIYPQLEHASWSGWTFTDWIFPFFLWIVGVAMTFSFAARKSKGDDNTKLILNVLRRAAIIFFLGLCLAAFPFGLAWGHHLDLSTLRIPGVLQRIAVCYFIGSFVYLFTTTRTQIYVIGGLFVTYWLMMFYYPVPDVGAGLFEKGRNFAAYIDSMFLSGHMWSVSRTWDPEGIFSTIPAIATTLFGAITGDYLRQSDHSKLEKSAWMFVYGAAFLLLGAFLDMWMPINKSLWTVSYSIFMNGWALCIFGIFYFLIDVKGIKKWAYPFSVYGMNAIFIFVLSGFVGRMMYMWKFTVTLSDGTVGDVTMKGLIMDNIFNPLFSPINASLAHAIAWMTCMYLIVWVMYKKKWFIKV